jgi:DNA-binding transcriptional ArsR family regulator
VAPPRSPLSSIELLIGLSHPSFLDSFERLLWWLFAGSAGGRTRSVILLGIREQPRNAQQLSQALDLDYTTIRHHLKVLERNRLVITEGEKYGKIYFVSDTMEAHWGKLEEMLKKMPRSKGGKR